MLKQAGADEVLIGVKYPWPQHLQKYRPDSHIAELDVAARFGCRYYFASCKVSPGEWARDAREAEAKAGRYLGRFGVPLAVRPWIDPAMRSKHGIPSAGAAYLGLADLIDPKKSRERLDAIWDARSTFSWAGPRVGDRPTSGSVETSMRRIQLSRKEINTRASVGGYICVNPETLQVILSDGSLSGLQGHEDVFPICMAFEGDDAKRGQFSNSLEGGDWTANPGRDTTRTHDGVYRSYGIDWGE